MSGVDLVQWLRDQLDEDERIARRVKSSWRQIGETGVIVASDGDRAEECANGNWTGIAEHIVEHDPARVLREIDAKRRMITEVAAAHASAIDMEHACCHDPEQILAGECEQHAPNDLPLLRLLALPYAGRPGYEEEWAS